MIRVTDKHIKEGKRGHCDACPVALAVLDCTGWDPKQILVGLNQITFFWHADDSFEVPLPAKVSHFIRRFDLGLKVTPFSFKPLENV